jgi:hypothetical protein
VRSYTFSSASEAFLALGGELLRDPEFIVSPRSQVTYEIRNASIQITNPADCTLEGVAGRKWSSRLAAAEFLQLAGGFSDPDAMVEIAPNMVEFLDPSGRFWGAYGERTGNYVGTAMERLKNDHVTRQCVVPVWDWRYDLMSGDEHRDLPCTVDMNFSVREVGGVEHLLMSTHMRSNDIWWGWSYDAFQFMQFGWTVANYLGVHMGPYTHYVDSLHLYSRNFEQMLDVVDRNLETSQPRPELEGLRIFHTDQWHTVKNIAVDLFYEPDAWGENDTEIWIVKTGVGMFGHDAQRKRDETDAQTVVGIDVDGDGDEPGPAE